MGGPLLESFPWRGEELGLIVKSEDQCEGRTSQAQRNEGGTSSENELVALGYQYKRPMSPLSGF